MTVASIRLRFFASARAAVGVDELDVPVTDGTTIGHALDFVPAAASAAPVLARCSFLVNGVATTDPATAVSAGDLVDVMPPFAGG